MQGIVVLYTRGVRANPRQFVLQHEIDAMRMQCDDVYGVRMDLEGVDWRLVSP